MRSMKQITILVTLLLVSVISGCFGGPIQGTQSSVDDLANFPPPHNVTLDIGNREYQFVGQDIESWISEYHPQLSENEMACNLIMNYSNMLLFYDRSPDSGHLLLAGMNNSHYVELIFTLEYTSTGDLGDVLAVDVFFGASYLNSMKTAWLEVVSQNCTHNWNISAEFRPFIWSYNYSDGPIESNYETIWQNPDINQSQFAMGWEFHTTSYQTLTFDPSADPSSWYRKEVWVPASVLVSNDVNVIQISIQPFTIASPTPNGPSLSYVLLIIGVAALGVIICILIRKYQL